MLEQFRQEERPIGGVAGAVEWALRTAVVISMAVAPAIGGVLADNYGFRIVYIVGAILFAVALLTNRPQLLRWAIWAWLIGGFGLLVSLDLAARFWAAPRRLRRFI